MPKFFAQNALGGCRLGGVIALLLLALPARGQYDPDWTRNFRIGGLVGFNIKADFKASGPFNIPGAKPGQPGVSGVDHVFDDGYVRVDASGNAADDEGTRWTTFWGYQNGSQLSTDGTTLAMHSTSKFDTGASSKSGVEDAPYYGFDMAYGGCIRQWQRTRLGWEAGFAWLPIKINTPTQTFKNASIEQSTYTFQTGGVILPQAPYNGSSSGGGQPSIQDIATLESTTNLNGTVTSSQELDVNLFILRLGPTFFWDVTPQIGLTLGAGPALGIAPGKLRFDDTIDTTAAGGTLVKNSGRFSSTEVVYGGYVNLMLTYHAVPNGDFYVSAQYMPMTSATYSGGGRQAKLNMGGALYLSGGVNWPF